MTAGENNTPTDTPPNDLELRDEEHEGLDAEDLDYYATQPGSAISASPSTTKSIACKAFVLLVGLVVIITGITLATQNDKDEGLLGDDFGDNPYNNPTEPAAPTNKGKHHTPHSPKTHVPISHLTPTLPPGITPGGPSSTTAPTISPLIVFLTTLLGEDPRQNTGSYQNSAFTWLDGNPGVYNLQEYRWVQRFALSCIYYQTGGENSWVDRSSWLTALSECMWAGVLCDQESNVVGLNLTKNGLTGVFPQEISLLHRTLVELDISSNELSNVEEELAWISKLTNLRIFDVQGTDFEADGIPSYIGALTDMRLLDLSHTLFYGPLDGSIFSNMQQLLYLELGGNWYNGTLPPEIMALPVLKALYVNDVGMTGSLDFIKDFNPDTMFELWMDSNPNLTGGIPTEIGSLANLASLSMSDCGLSGELPSELGKLTAMQQMWLYDNKFSGKIPSEIGELTNMVIFQVEDNDLTGEMPIEICSLRSGPEAVDGLLALGADCNSEVTCGTDCCTCCESPCPVTPFPDDDDDDDRRRLAHFRL